MRARPCPFHGPYRVGADGQLGTVGQYHYGKPVGVWRGWYADGKRQGEESFERPLGWEGDIGRGGQRGRTIPRDNLTRMQRRADVERGDAGRIRTHGDRSVDGLENHRS